MNIMHTRNRKEEGSCRPKSLNIGRRRKDQENIIRENLMLLKRISEKKSDYAKDRIDRQWRQNEKYQELLGGYNPQSTMKKHRTKRGLS